VRWTDGAETDLLRLYRKLLNNYEADVRPAVNHSSPLNVTFGFSLTQIIDVVRVRSAPVRPRANSLTLPLTGRT
jgi:hypothetical protein